MALPGGGGGYLRDWDTLNRVVGLCANHNADDIKFTVITSRGEFKNLRPSANLTVLGGVSEDDLLACYHSCDLVLLPLTDCVASNSLLEGLACGKPVIVTDVGGVCDYVDESCARLVPRAEPEAVYDSISALLDDTKLRTQMAVAARARAERFAWPEIAAQVRRLYSQVFQ